MLQHLLAAADWASPFPPQAKLRALRALKHVFRGLVNKRFVAEPVAGAAMGEGTRLCLFARMARARKRLPPATLVERCKVAV